MRATRYIAVFAAGMVAGALVHRHWDRIEAAGGPRLRRVMAGGDRVLARGKRAVMERVEWLQDLVAEIREEDEQQDGAA